MSFVKPIICISGMVQCNECYMHFEVAGMCLYINTLLHIGVHFIVLIFLHRSSIVKYDYYTLKGFFKLICKRFLIMSQI